NGRDETERAFRTRRDAVVTFDQLRTLDVVNLVVLVTRIGHPSPGECHQTSAVNGLAALVEVIQLVGDVAGRGAEQDRGRDDQRAQQATDADRDERQRRTDHRTGDRAGNRPSDRANRTTDGRVVAHMRTNFAVQRVLPGTLIHDGECRSITRRIATAYLG